MASVTLPYNLLAGSPENVNNLMSNLNALKDGVNTIDTAQLASGAVTKAKLGADVYPYAMATGQIYGGAVETTVTFPSGRFSVAPNIAVSNADGYTKVKITQLSSSTFKFQCESGNNHSVFYIAVQMSSSAASA